MCAWLGRRLGTRVRAAAVAVLGAFGGAACAQSPQVVVLVVDGMINPATAEYVLRGLDRAQNESAALVVLELDTPGGLDTSMRAIIKEILASRVPVATWVGPSGARAASAGTYILYASHFAAMAPASNLGAATPVAVGGPGPAEPPDDRAKAPPDTMHEKMVNDAAAFIRSLAQLRGRNAEFAEKAVRQAKSMPAQEALKAGVIDLIAQDVPDLVHQLDGRHVTAAGASITLALAGAQIETVRAGWRTEVLSVLSHPTVALMLMMLGVYGLFIEVIHPGLALPGVAGGICLLLALYALHLLPVNWAGVALILLGLGLMIAEVFLPTFGVIGVGGIVALIVGGMMLIHAPGGAPAIPLPFLVGAAAVSAAVFFGLGTLALRARRRPVVSGSEGMIGALGIVTVVDEQGAWAQVQGASWRVRSRDPLTAGASVRVEKVDGLTLVVGTAG